MQPIVKDEPATVFLASRHRATIAQIPIIAGDENAPGAVIEAARQAGIVITGPSTFIYLGADGNPNTQFDLLVAFPIGQRPAQAPAGLEVVDSPAFRCIAVDYVGGMPGIHTGYAALMEAVGRQGLRPTRESREIYKTWVDSDSPDNVTELQIGIE